MQANRTYEDVEMNTMPKINLVIMCYDKIIDLLEKAINEINTKKYDNKSELLSKAISIITELMSALDFKKGKQIAHGLNNIYLYCINKIIEADSTDNSDVLKDVISILSELNDAWKMIAKKEFNKTSHYDNLRIQSA